MLNSLLLAGVAIFCILIGVLITLLIWNKPSTVIYIQILYCFFVRFLTIQIGIPSAIKYIFDYLTIILLLQIILHSNKTYNINIRKPLIFMALFAAVAIISTVYNGSSFVLFFWGIRLNFRFFIFFIACVIFLKRKNLDDIMKLLLIMLPINTVLVVYQYAVMGLRFDYLGGLFGTHLASHSEFITYLIIVTLISIILYVEKKLNIVQLLLDLGMLLFLAAICEIKVLFIIIPMIVVVAAFLSFPNSRALNLIIACVVLMPLSFSLMLIIYPQWAEQLSNIQDAIFNTTMVQYSSEVSLSRFTAASYLLTNIIVEPFQKVFGIGFGNADYFLTYTSSFYERYDMLNYNIFRYSLVLIELGVIGLIVYCLFFVSLTLESIRIRKIVNPEVKYYCNIGFIISLIVFPLLIYNPSLQMEGAFMVYLLLAFPFIFEKEMYEANLNYGTNETNLKLSEARNSI